jgi:hypothetical protein
MSEADSEVRPADKRDRPLPRALKCKRETEPSLDPSRKTAKDALGDDADWLFGGGLPLEVWAHIVDFAYGDVAPVVTLLRTCGALHSLVRAQQQRTPAECRHRSAEVVWLTGSFVPASET